MITRINPPYLFDVGRRRVADTAALNRPPWFGDYIEPYLGGGATALAMMQAAPDARYRLSSTNAGLVAVWNAAPRDVDALALRVREYGRRHRELTVRASAGTSGLAGFAEGMRARVTAQADGTADGASLDREIESAAEYLYLCGVSTDGGNGLARVPGSDGVRAQEWTGTAATAVRETMVFDESNLRRFAELVADRDVTVGVAASFGVLPGIREDDLVYVDPLPGEETAAALKAFVQTVTAKGAFVLASRRTADGGATEYDGWTTLARLPGVDAELELWANRLLLRALRQ